MPGRKFPKVIMSQRLGSIPLFFYFLCLVVSFFEIIEAHCGEDFAMAFNLSKACWRFRRDG